MRFPKIFLLGTGLLFLSILVLSLGKKKKQGNFENVTKLHRPLIEISLPEDRSSSACRETEENLLIENDLPEANLVDRLFKTDNSKLPIVETITYTSQVPWLVGRCAWIADYASYYETSRYFIARSLQQQDCYSWHGVAPGDQFNVLSLKKAIEFHLILDLSRSRIWFYYLDLEKNARTLLKTYQAGIRPTAQQERAECLIEPGIYRVGEEVAVYQPGIMGYALEEKVEMVRVFGTRRLPCKPVEQRGEQAGHAFAIQGLPQLEGSQRDCGEDANMLAKGRSGKAVQMARQDIEELFAIVITKPTFVHVVSDFYEAKLPGTEDL
ncbi:MAG: L,D-transpeptidase [Chlamydiota bacterium]